MLQANFYELLGIPQDATLEEIRWAYHEAARKLHPDVNKEASANELFLKVKQAYDTLIDASVRQTYDEKLKAETQVYLKSETLFSRPVIPILTEPQLIYALLNFSPSQSSGQRVSPIINLCLIIDRSTSMQGERMDTIKTAAIELIRQLQPKDLLSIVVFSDRADVLLTSSQRIDRSSIETQIRMLRAGGGTEIFQGLEAGYNEVRNNSSKTFINHIILLTDGRTYGDEEACLKLADAAAREGVHIHGLGIGTDWNDVFLDELAIRTGGSTNYIHRAEDIRKFLHEKFSSLSKIFAERVSMNLETGSSATLNAAFRLQPEPAVLPTQFPLRLGNIPLDAKLSILLEFIVDPLPEDTYRAKIASGELAFQPLSPGTISQKIGFNLTRLIGDSSPTDLPPQPIFHALSQITLFKMQDKARKEVQDGNIQEASLRLQRLATQLMSMGERELAQTALVEAERIHRTHTLSAEGEKKIKYGTRVFLLPEPSESEIT